MVAMPRARIFKESILRGIRQRGRKKAAEAAFDKLEQYRLLQAIFLAEFLDPTSGIHNLLLSRIKRVTLRAHFDAKIVVHRGAGFEAIAATTRHGHFVVLRMNS